MRTLVDMSEAQIDALDLIARREQRSRAALIRTAVDDYLERHHRREVDDGFGLWGNGKVDGLDYQEKVRGEW